MRPTVLDACLDALTAVALVADEVGDRCGAIAFDREVRARAAAAAARAGRVVVRALFDLQPRLVDSDYEAAFRRVEGAKRAFVLVLSDLLEEAAARPLVEAMPVLARRHAVVVASPADPALAALAAAPPAGDGDARAGRRRRRRARPPAPAPPRSCAPPAPQVVEAPPTGSRARASTAYLRAKSRARL